MEEGVARESRWGPLLGRKEGLVTSGKGPVGMREEKRAVVKGGVGRVVWGHAGPRSFPKTPPYQQTPRNRPARTPELPQRGPYPTPTHSSLLCKQPMANQDSGSSRLPLALPPASQGCSSGGSGSSAGGSDNPPPPRNLQGLLQMAITAGSEEPDLPPEPMSEEVKGGDPRSWGEGRGDRYLGRGGSPAVKA